jgi:hypothetical protein
MGDNVLACPQWEDSRRVLEMIHEHAGIAQVFGVLMLTASGSGRAICSAAGDRNRVRCRRISPRGVTARGQRRRRRLLAAGMRRGVFGKSCGQMPASSLRANDLAGPHDLRLSGWRHRSESALSASGWQGARRVAVEELVCASARHAPCWPAARQRSAAALRHPRAPAPFSSTGCGSHLMPMRRQGPVSVLAEGRFGSARA